MFLCSYLLTEQSRLRSVNDIMPMIGARFYTQLDASQMRNDVIEEDLAKVREAALPFRSGIVFKNSSGKTENVHENTTFSHSLIRLIFLGWGRKRGIGLVSLEGSCVHTGCCMVYCRLQSRL